MSRVCRSTQDKETNIFLCFDQAGDTSAFAKRQVPRKVLSVFQRHWCGGRLEHILLPMCMRLKVDQQLQRLQVVWSSATCKI